MMDYGTSSDPKVKVVRTKIAAMIIFVSHSMASFESCWIF